MSRTSTMKDSSRTAIRRAFLGSLAVLLLPFLPMGIAAAQSAAGPLPAAAPSDQRSQPPPARADSQAIGKPKLAGTWKLNADQSDKPLERVREAQQGSDGQWGGGSRRDGWGTGDRPGAGAGGSSGGNGNAQQNGGDQQGGAGRRRGGLQERAQLVIEQTPTSTKVSDASGRMIALYLAPSEPGSSQSSSAQGDVNPTPIAQWQDSKLVTTQQTGNGGITTRTYEMSSDNKQLIVTTKIESRRLKEPVMIRQVYDPVYASTGGD